MRRRLVLTVRNQGTKRSGPLTVQVGDWLVTHDFYGEVAELLSETFYRLNNVPAGESRVIYYDQVKPGNWFGAYADYYHQVSEIHEDNNGGAVQNR